MKKNIIVLLFIAVLSAMNVHAQYVLKAANKQFDLYNYASAIELYAKAYKKKQTTYTADRLAQSYRKLFKYNEAEQWYKIADSLPKAAAKSTLNYGLALQANGKYAEAKSVFERYASKGDSTMTKTQVARLIASCDTAKVLMSNPSEVKVENQQELNSSQSDWAPFVYNGNVLFTSDRMLSAALSKTQKKPFLRFDTQVIKPGDKNYLWSGKDYERIYQSNLKDSLILFPLKTDTRYHVGPASVSKDGQEIFYALTRMPKRIKKKGKIATINVEIYSSKREGDGKWGKPISLPINKATAYSVGDPFIKGDTLYFSSNMPGGKGGTDLYYVVRTGDTWGTPQNIALLNTEGDERSPAMDDDGSFYFASNGYVGMGGLDLYETRNIFESPTIRNLGYPINSPKDDFAISLTSRGKEAKYFSSKDNVPISLLAGDEGVQFFSSNRDGGNGEDDIYSLSKPKLDKLVQPAQEAQANQPPEVSVEKREAMLSGIAYSELTKQPIRNAKIVLTDGEGQRKETLTNEDGEYSIALTTNSNYELNATKDGFKPLRQVFDTDVADSYQKDLYLSAKTKVLYNKSVKNKITMTKVYYNFDKYDVRPDAANQLEKIVAIMKKYSDIKIELSSYTDSRGPAIYNEWLSQKRADAAVEYLVNRGISRDRLVAKGYGETGLINKCADGVKCTRAQHQINRRTEFQIIEE